jgi:hypothetical protein
MLLATQLGLLPEDLQLLVFSKLRRMSQWDALKKKMSVMIPESMAKWMNIVEFTVDGLVMEPFFYWQKSIKFASGFKLLEISAVIREETPTVAVYLFNLEFRAYEYIDENIVESLFDLVEEDEE